MPKINEESATKEFNSLLELWGDGKEVSFSQPEFKAAYNSIVKKIMAGKVQIDLTKEAVTFKNRRSDEILSFGVPRGDAVLELTQDMKGVVQFAEKMGSLNLGALSNMDSRDTLTAVSIANVFLLLSQ